jgi:hypothetical protein
MSALVGLLLPNPSVRADPAVFFLPLIGLFDDDVDSRCGSLPLPDDGKSRLDPDDPDLRNGNDPLIASIFIVSTHSTASVTQTATLL